MTDLFLGHLATLLRLKLLYSVELAEDIWMLIDENVEVSGLSRVKILI